MTEHKRKYYRAIMHRIPPYASINACYDYEEDVYAFSKEGAVKSIIKFHSKGYGSNYIKEIREITKEEFRGNHERY